MDERIKFYQRVVTNHIPDKDASILVCAGGSRDRNMFMKSGYTRVTITNLDERMEGDKYFPFEWKYENAEFLSFEDESYDYVIIHAAMHHASMPHKVLAEMYRVARIGVIAIEARDSMIMRILERLQLVQVYEHAAVYFSDCKYGGVNNTDIPNYIYRWTEREIEKTIRSYAPHTSHKFSYTYGTGFPYTPGLENRADVKIVLLKLIRPLYWIFVKLFPRQQNLFAVHIEKPSIPDMLYPWLAFDEQEGRISFKKEWGDRRYKDPQRPSG